MSEKELLHRTMARVNARAWGVATGLILGLGLFIATNVLVLRGGTDVGAHLGRLGQVLPGYNVTFVGSLIGLMYGFVIGYGLGRLIGPRRPLSRTRTPSGRAHVRLNAPVLGLTLGIAGGIALFAVTNVLAGKGGLHPGQMLEHLHVYLPGYRVDFGGSLIGLVWIVVLGFAVGELIALVYNRAVERAEG